MCTGLKKIKQTNKNKKTELNDVKQVLFASQVSIEPRVLPCRWHICGWNSIFFRIIMMVMNGGLPAAQILSCLRPFQRVKADQMFKFSDKYVKAITILGWLHLQGSILNHVEGVS